MGKTLFRDLIFVLKLTSSSPTPPPAPRKDKLNKGRLGFAQVTNLVLESV